MHCRSCGTEVAEKAVACLKCGQNPETGIKHCPNCGSESKENAIICTSCGGSLIASAGHGHGQGQVSEVLAGFLNWLWGGTAYFYLGQTVKGIVFSIITLFFIIFDIMTCSFGLLFHVPFSIFLIIDAVKLAGRINRGETLDDWGFF